MRAVAAAVGVLLALATIVLARRLGGRITALAAGLLVAAAGSSPFIEGFTLSGELLASVWVALALCAFTGYVRGRRLPWAFAAGLLGGLAVLTKQSAIDAVLAAAAWLVWRERRRAGRALVALLAGAAIPVAVAAATAYRLGAWWFAVVGYRGRGDSLLTGTFSSRLHMLADSLPPAAKALALLALLAAVGWTRAPLLARLWVVAAALGVLGGGNFHPHYYVQLVPPLAVLAAFGLERLGARGAVIACAAVVVALVVVAAPLWLESPREQAREIWPHDPHLLHDRAVADYVHAHARAREKVYVVWAAADVYYLADRRPAFKYLWFRNVQTIPHALRDARRMLRAKRPALVVVAQPPGSLDRSGETERILRRDYRPAARVEGVRIYRRRTRRALF